MNRDQVADVGVEAVDVYIKGGAKILRYGDSN